MRLLWLECLLVSLVWACLIVSAFVLNAWAGWVLVLAAAVHAARALLRVKWDAVKVLLALPRWVVNAAIVVIGVAVGLREAWRLQVAQRSIRRKRRQMLAQAVRADVPASGAE